MRDIEMDLEWEGLDEAFADLERQCAETVRGIAIETWNFVLAQTPQYLGRMAASWTFSLERPIFVDRSHTVEQGEDQIDEDGTFIEHALYKGHPEAIDTANTFSRGNELGFRLGMNIFFANGVNHGEGPYSADVESGGIRLRSVNRPGAPARRALDRITARYADGVTARQAEQLRTFRIGG